ncbi:MAG: SDR family NAD(P)-dependent oxidoreductase [Myxococcota bacterium]|jgi:NAD(P)-dependent dehydrogenase (short-subunit alcohol dehydrogenase family)|nr:short-chain dehydrogenase [Deltaproteobacteria bacterium]MCP4242014.1 SDR family oxidoreductase [bacterium]MDP6075290.1 SDR family NAD(P)-dependent oxidoreductase [Myxococcota bacterium]MBT39399.1 short-chain dehydrogenase [Deltaproteobacteria bacterium]MDP6243690.1 SDR family NAD(P)-dependent oxidoreductase [Myxococcota bacterium]
MQDFDDKIAVITGGGTGMGRELARQLAASGCHVAICDLSGEEMEKTRSLCESDSPEGTRLLTCVADVSDESQLEDFRTAICRELETDCVNLVFNNAGIGGAGSMIVDERDEWERTFDICWKGVYYGTRTFLPLLVASDEGHLVNTSSVNGFWASLGPEIPHTAYSAAKFAVKGFSEALVNDFRLNAPHVKVSVVMPGHIGTSILINSGKILGRTPKDMTDEELEELRERIERMGIELGNVTPEQMRVFLQMRAEQFRDAAPTTAAEAATTILDGVREERWRILVGADAEIIDRMVREAPEEAYEEDFMERLRAQTGWSLGG